MDEDELLALLERVARGERTASEAARVLAAPPVPVGPSADSADLDLGFAKLDLGRAARTGAAEAVYAESKSEEELTAIVDALIGRTGTVLVTRLSEARADRLAERHPAGHHHRRARIWTHGDPSPSIGVRTVVVSAGTSDLGVAEEAAVTADWLGLEVERCHDVGVAGLDRLLSRLEWLRGFELVIAVAGMDGALPTVIAGLVGAPVVGVPTSVGYGAAFAGLAPLLTMLNGCAPGVAVVNIDNGYGAAVLARRIAGLSIRRPAD